MVAHRNKIKYAGYEFQVTKCRCWWRAEQGRHCVNPESKTNMSKKPNDLLLCTNILIRFSCSRLRKTRNEKKNEVFFGQKPNNRSGVIIKKVFCRFRFRFIRIQYRKLVKQERNNFWEFFQTWETSRFRLKTNPCYFLLNFQVSQVCFVHASLSFLHIVSRIVRQKIHKT